MKKNTKKQFTVIVKREGQVPMIENFSKFCDMIEYLMILNAFQAVAEHENEKENKKTPKIQYFTAMNFTEN